MAVRRILRMGHPNLRKTALPVDLTTIDKADFHNLLEDMRDTLADYGGVGLAAPQIDIPLRLAIIEIGAVPSRYGAIGEVPFTVFINPQITPLTTTTAGYWEGCLSVPGLRGYVERPTHLRVDYRNANGEKSMLELRGFQATVIQHEFDHLDGKLYIDRIRNPELLVFEDQLTRHDGFWQHHPSVAAQTEPSEPTI